MTKESKTAPRTYIVLARKSEHVLHELGEAKATNPDSAIRAVVGDPEDGNYVAVPERNWSEVGGEVEERPPLFKLTPVERKPVEQPRLPLAVVEGEAESK